MHPFESQRVVSLDLGLPIWDRFFTVAPLVLVGTREENGRHNLAPKHMAFPLGWDNYFGFVCTPKHRTYQNVAREGVFTVSYPRPSQVVLTSMAATPRDDDDIKPALSVVPSVPAMHIDGAFFQDSYLFLECRLNRFVEALGENALIVGDIVAAHVHADALRLQDRDDHELINRSPLLAYLYPGRFTRIAESFSFPFPVGFRR